jgi:RNA polymerase sigma-70 factor (ECF subfamily)
LNLLDRRRTATAYSRAESELEPATADGPDAVLDRAQRAAEVVATLAMLPLELREILALKYMRDYDYAALAALLRIPRGTVMSRLHHARKAFQDAYRRRAGENTTAAGAPYGEESYG